MKENRKKENEEKSMFSLLLFGWRENMRENKKKENEEYIKWHIYSYYMIKYKYCFYLIFKFFL